MYLDIFYLRLLVRLGELDAKTSNICSTSGSTLCTESQDFEIENVVHHPNYDNPKYANDIALIRLRRKSNSSNILLYLKFITLPQL